MAEKRGHINREALRAVNGLGGRQRRPLARLVTAESFGDGLVKMRAPDGSAMIHVEEAEVQGRLDLGWTIE